jgi:hypothetical protein
MADVITRATQSRDPLTDPATGKPLAPREQPGYYPGYQTLRQQKFWDEATRKVVLERVQHQGAIRFFTEDEARTMLAVVDRILPQDDRQEHRRIPILPALDRRLHLGKINGYRYEDMPSDREAYRIAARALELMAQRLRDRRFDQLPTLEQEKLLKSIHDGDPAEAREEWQKMNVERFWTMLVGDVCSIYYAHPWAWDEIGYGGPAYPRGYMRLEDGEPEPYEVDEERYAWAAPADTLSSVEEAHGRGAEHQTGDEGGTL